MNVLVATTATQGARLRASGMDTTDFAYIFGPEPVQLAPTCGADTDDPDGDCGCERAFLGIRSRRPITTAVVVERDITTEQCVSLLRRGMLDAGYLRFWNDAGIRRMAEQATEEMIDAAAHLLPGTIVERRGQGVLRRGWSATAGLPADEDPVPDRDEDERRGDNGFVSIDFLGDDDVFPAWIVPDYRWNGWAVPDFSRETVARVVDWTNRLHAEYPDGAASAKWDGEDILLIEAGWEDEGPLRITPDKRGRYHFGEAWCWSDQRCRICDEPVRTGPDEGSAVLLHHPHCPPYPADQPDHWPLRGHHLI